MLVKILVNEIGSVGGLHCHELAPGERILGKKSAACLLECHCQIDTAVELFENRSRDGVAFQVESKQALKRHEFSESRQGDRAHAKQAALDEVATQQLDDRLAVRVGNPRPDTKSGDDIELGQVGAFQQLLEGRGQRPQPRSGGRRERVRRGRVRHIYVGAPIDAGAGSGMNIERDAVAVPEFEVAQRTGRRKRDGSIERGELQIRRRTLGIVDMGIGSCGDVPVELFLHAPSRIDPTTLMYTISCKYIDGEEVTRPDRSGNCGIVIAVP